MVLLLIAYSAFSLGKPLSFLYVEKNMDCLHCYFLRPTLMIG